MASASDIRAGQVIRVDNKLWKIVEQEAHGKGKFGKMVHVKLKSLEDGHSVERSFRYEDKVEDVDAQRLKMEYLYRDNDALVFMNPQDYTQPRISAAVIGKQEIFLKENMEMDVLLVEGKIISVEFPETVELKVVMAPEGGKGHVDKEIELENGIKVRAPQFVKEGESVRINTHDFSYLDRVTTKSMSDHTIHAPREKSEKPEKKKEEK